MALVSTQVCDLSQRLELVSCSSASPLHGVKFGKPQSLGIRRPIASTQADVLCLPANTTILHLTLNSQAKENDKPWTNRCTIESIEVSPLVSGTPAPESLLEPGHNERMEPVPPGQGWTTRTPILRPRVLALGLRRGLPKHAHGRHAKLLTRRLGSGGLQVSACQLLLDNGGMPGDACFQGFASRLRMHICMCEVSCGCSRDVSGP